MRVEILSTFKKTKHGSAFKREKIGRGQLLFYPGIYHDEKRWYEFPNIHISKNRPSEQHKEKKGWHRK